MTTCRHCGANLTQTFADLGSMPPANSYVRADKADEPEKEYPLRAMVCDNCLLVQLDTTVPPEDIFQDYDYFSSTSPSWVAEAEKKCEHLIKRFNLGPESLVVEVGSNDGYLLKHFVNRGVRVYGVDPAEECAEEARRNGVPTFTGFFGERFAESGEEKADLITGTNVFAHVPLINDFVAGLSKLVKPDGVVVMEFPHLLTLINEAQFDTIYHEHYFYFSLYSVLRVFESHGLHVFDVETLPTHGGSLRVYARHEGKHLITTGVWDTLSEEYAAGLFTLDGYKGFQAKVDAVAAGAREFLATHRNVAAYGAPAKGSTFLNFCGIDAGDILFAVDDSPHKQGKLMPGSGIPIVGRDRLLEEKPDHILVLPWNLLEPIRERNPEVAEWGGKWVTAIPEIRIVP